MFLSSKTCSPILSSCRHHRYDQLHNFKLRRRRESRETIDFASTTELLRHESVPAHLKLFKVSTHLTLMGYLPILALMSECGTTSSCSRTQSPPDVRTLSRTRLITIDMIHSFLHGCAMRRGMRCSYRWQSLYIALSLHHRLLQCLVSLCSLRNSVALLFP